MRNIWRDPRAAGRPWTVIGNHATEIIAARDSRSETGSSAEKEEFLPLLLRLRREFVGQNRGEDREASAVRSRSTDLPVFRVSYGDT